MFLRGRGTPINIFSTSLELCRVTITTTCEMKCLIYTKGLSGSYKRIY